MSYNICKIKNIDSIDHSIKGTVLAPNDELQIQDAIRSAVSSDSIILTKIAEGKLQVGTSSAYLTDLNSQLNWLKDIVATETKSKQYPFAEKQLQDGKKIYARITGAQYSTLVGDNTLNFSIPFPHCKVTGIEILGGDLGDSVSLYVLDDESGTYTTVPNYQLNQFGYGIYITPSYYKRESQYDADLYQNMVIKVVYNTSTAKPVYINYMLHEIKE